MPIVIDFGASIPKASRTAVQNRLFVTSSPAQIGAWRWISDREVVYRPQSYWKTGTTLSVRSALGGVPVGGRVLDKDRTAVATIGRDLEMSVTNKNHMMTVISNGKVIKRYPISMGTVEHSVVVRPVRHYGSAARDHLRHAGCRPGRLPRRSEVCRAPDLERHVPALGAVVGLRT